MADRSGSVVVDAVVTPEADGGPGPRTTITDGAGAFHFAALRSTPARGGGGALEYHRLEDSGRTALTLYEERDTALARAR